MITKQTAAPALAWRPRLTIALLFSYFVLFGIMIGGQGVLWAEVIAALGISKGLFGTIQLVSPLLSVLVLFNGAQLAYWAGKKPLALAGLVLLMGTNLALAIAGGLIGVVFGLLLLGVGSALLDMVANSATLDWEQATGQSVMNLMHAGFSGAAVLGAFMAGLLLNSGWHYPAILVLIGGVCLLALLFTILTRFPPAE